MPSKKIKKDLVNAAVAEDRVYFIWDTEVKGFGLKVMKTGKKVYVLQYRNGGRESSTKRFTIGDHGSPWTPDEARKEALRLLTLLRQGADPREAERKRRSAAVALAFEDYAEFFTEKYLKVDWKESWQEAERILNRDVVPVFRRRPLTEITKADINDLLSTMDDRPASKRLTYAVLHKLFNWAHQERDDIPASPMTSMKAPPTVPKRHRCLSAEELACYMLAIRDVPYR